MSNTEHFKTLEFTDNRKDTIGKYVHIHDVGGLSFYGSDLPQLMPMTCTMEGLKSFYQSIDFTGIKLVEKHLISVVWDKAIADPATPESTANWQKVGDQDQWLDEVRGRESGEEKIKQRILTAYYAGFNQAHYSHVHPESFEVKECQSAGEEYLLKNEKWIDADLKEYASLVNERKDIGMEESSEGRVKKCPFCNREPYEGGTKDGRFVIKCYSCGVEMIQDRKDKVIGMWNARVVNERKVEFYRNETSKIRKYVFDNNIGRPSQSVFDAIIQEVERLNILVNERKDKLPLEWSPVESEKKWQEEQFKILFPNIENDQPDWQRLNFFIEAALKYLEKNERKDNVQVFCAICGGSITETGTAYKGKPVHIGCYYKANNEMEDIHADFKQVTGHDSPKEMAAYEKGREDEQQVIIEWIEKWDGSGNSVMGTTLKKVFEKLRKDNVGVVSLSELSQLLNDIYQLIGGFSMDEVWSEWDESVKKRVLKMQIKLQSKSQPKAIIEDEIIIAPSFEECPKCHAI